MGWFRWTSRLSAVLLALLAMATMIGCRSGKQVVFDRLTPNNASHEELEFSRQLPPETTRSTHAHVFSRPPLTSASQLPPYWEVSLNDVIHMALRDTQILRSLGAQLLEDPRQVSGVLDPAIQSSDPNFGTAAALSQFDANVSASLVHANNDNVFNNSILGGGATEVVQDLTTADIALTKIGQTGTQFTLRSNFLYDSNDNPTSTFPSSYTGFWEASIRRPLMQGAGVDFNQIAGPNARLGFRNTTGLKLSRIDTDISIAEFEQNVRQFVNEVINEYWQLHFAYQQFEATSDARDAARRTWTAVKARMENELVGGEADKEAQAREQYYSFEQQLISALNGAPQSGRTGILQTEANLRRLIGLPQNDDRLLFPSDQPIQAQTLFDWGSIVNLALDQRVEIRTQLWKIRRSELELLASQNFLQPRLDAVATYRNNGFGDDLIGGGFRFSSVVSDMSTGDHNEWEMGLLFNVPLGYRQAQTAVRNSELKLQRERSVLEEQEKQIIHQLGTAVRQSEQYGTSLQFALERMKAAQDTVQAREAGYEADKIPLDLLLDAQRRLSDAQTAFYLTQVNLQLANEGVHRESGQLLASHGIDLGQAVMTMSARTTTSQFASHQSEPINYSVDQ